MLLSEQELSMNFVFVKRRNGNCINLYCYYLIYATKNQGKIVLRSIDNNGFDSVFNDNIIAMGNIRIYASGN